LPGLAGPVLQSILNPTCQSSKPEVSAKRGRRKFSGASGLISFS
jgi:hypothetical protein